MPTSDKFDAEYQELIREHQRLLHDFIFAIFPDHTSVDDVCQETNRVLWEKRDQFELGTNFRAWARKIAHFQTLSHLKRIKRKSWLRFDSDLVQALAETYQENDEHREKRAKAMKECRKLLSPEDQRLLNMRYESNLSQREISLKTARTEGALKQVFLRIRNQLRKCVKRKITSNPS